MLIRSRDDLSTYAGNIRILCLHFAFEILFTFLASKIGNINWTMTSTEPITSIGCNLPGRIRRIRIACFTNIFKMAWKKQGQATYLGMTLSIESGIKVPKIDLIFLDLWHWELLLLHQTVNLGIKFILIDLMCLYWISISNMFYLWQVQVKIKWKVKNVAIPSLHHEGSRKRQ